MQNNDSSIRLSLSDASSGTDPILTARSDCGPSPVKRSMIHNNNNNNSNTTHGHDQSQSSHARSFDVATERGGRKIMSEDEVSSLVHSALRRAREAAGSFSSRSSLSNSNSYKSSSNNNSSNKIGGGGGGSSSLLSSQRSSYETIKEDNDDDENENNKSSKNATFSPRSTSTPKSKSGGFITSPRSPPPSIYSKPSRSFCGRSSDSASPTKMGRPPIHSPLSGSPPSNSGSRQQPNYSSSSSSPTKKRIYVPNLSSPRSYYGNNDNDNDNEEENINNGGDGSGVGGSAHGNKYYTNGGPSSSTMRSTRSTRSTRTMASYHTARLGDGTTPTTPGGGKRGDGDGGSTFSFDDFHTPTHSSCEVDAEAQEVVDIPSSKEFQVVMGKFSMESTSSGDNIEVIQIDDDDDNDDDNNDDNDYDYDDDLDNIYSNQLSGSDNSVNSSEDIIRRVEEEIANARKAAKEATRRLAGVTADFRAKKAAKKGGKTTPDDDNNNNNNNIPTDVGGIIADLAVSSTPDKQVDIVNNITTSNSNITEESMDHFDSALNIIGEEFDDEAIDDNKCVDDSNNTKVLNDENHSLSANTTEERNCDEEDEMEVITTCPTTEELNAFLADDYSNKRIRSINFDDRPEDNKEINSDETNVQSLLPSDELNDVVKNEEDRTNIDDKMRGNINKEDEDAAAGDVLSDSSLIEQQVGVPSNGSVPVENSKFEEAMSNDDTMELGDITSDSEAPKVVLTPSTVGCILDHVSPDKLKGFISEGLENVLSNEAETWEQKYIFSESMSTEQDDQYVANDNASSRTENRGDFQTQEKGSILSGTDQDQDREKKKDEDQVQELPDDCSGHHSTDPEDVDAVRQGEISTLGDKYMQESDNEPSEDNVFIYQVVTPATSIDAKSTGRMTLSPKGSLSAIDEIKCGAVDEAIEVLAEPIEYTLNNDEAKEDITRMNTSDSEKSQNDTGSNEAIEEFENAVAYEQHNNAGDAGTEEQGADEHSHNGKADSEQSDKQLATDFQNIEIDENELDSESKAHRSYEETLVSNEESNAFLDADLIESKSDDGQSVNNKIYIQKVAEDQEKASYDDFCADYKPKNEEDTRQWDDRAVSEDQTTAVMNNTVHHNTAMLLSNVLAGREKNQRSIEKTDLDEDIASHSPPLADPPTSPIIQRTSILLTNVQEYQHEDCTAVSGKPPPIPLSKERKGPVDHVNDFESRGTKVRFKQRYPVPQQMRKNRHPSEIVFDHRSEKPGDILFYSKPKNDLKKLLEAATGSSIPRRSNACGALKVLSTQKKNQRTLIRTQGFLDALVFAIKDNYSIGDIEAGEAARTRAVNVVLNVSIRDNRYHVLSHPGLADSLVKCMMDDKGQARELACATLATLAKTQNCRELMATTPNLVDVLSIILKGDDPSLSDKYHPNNLDAHLDEDEEKINYSGDDEMSHVISDSYSSSSSTTNSSLGQDSAEAQEDLETLKRTRMNACAALLHLSKECSISRKLCASNTLLSCLVAASKEATNPIHTKCLEILANLTRFPQNNVCLVEYPGLIDTLITNGSHKCDTDRLWSMRILQNLSSETSAKSILASSSVLELLSTNMMRPQYKEQLAATATICNISTEPGAVVPLTNTKNVVATLVHVAHSPTSVLEVRLIACDTLATLGLWLQTLAGAGTIPGGVKASPLPTYITSGWQRWDK